ncbi:MAG: nucleotidyl transferase AbiEii/AbiGii toxin family protein [Candidatus Marinimicrobia bacterium]|nr:nucleotidyl transferase AbiEii/AbiGii toxin family protein [Candidatus Neomarinimicrobiota bacterium]
MIDQKSITKAWIEEVSKKNSNADKILIEKVIRAFLLLEGLGKQSLPFIFKGGTSLMLHFQSANRFSIDIDIVYLGSPDDMGSIFEKVAIEQGFIRKEKQVRASHANVPKAHYKFYYPSLIDLQKQEGSILLDVLFEKDHYKNISKLPVQSKFIPEDGQAINVSVPSPEDLLGDKLTAFAPETTGIPYYKNKQSMSMEIIKQLYDIGSLFNIAEDMNIVSSTFRTFAEVELNYRQHDDLDVEDVMDNIYDTSLHIVSNGLLGKGNYNELFKGVKRIKNYIYSESFNIEKAKIMASKAAYLVFCIKNGSKNLEKYSSPDELKDWSIDDPTFGKIQRLKRTNPEAYYYWYKILNR